MKAGFRVSGLVPFCLLFLCCLGNSALLLGQTGMISPDIDLPGEPFSYFYHPTDEISTFLAAVGSEVTPEGYVWTGFGELMFFAGNPPEPIKVRIKTLHKGYLPIIQYHLVENGVRYEFTAFASNLGGGLEGLPVNFVEVRLRNEVKENRAAFLSSAYRFRGPVNVMYHEPDFRFRQSFGLFPKQLVEGQTIFNPNWHYSYGKNSLLRDGRVVYLFPTKPGPFEFSMSLRDKGLRRYRYFTVQVQEVPATVSAEPDTAGGLATYRILLKPGESQALVFKIPIVPLPERSAEEQQVEQADYAKEFQKTVSFWEDLVGKSPALRFSEGKVQNFLLSNTVYNLLAIDKRGDEYLPVDAKLVHHGYYGGLNTADVLVALDYMGQADIAKKVLLHSLTAQRADGAFAFEKPYQRWESFGYTLWSWGVHYGLTRDAEFLRQVYPGVIKAMEWEKRVTEADPLGLDHRSLNNDTFWPVYVLMSHGLPKEAQHLTVH